jgi:hypothetical protein
VSTSKAADQDWGQGKITWKHVMGFQRLVIAAILSGLITLLFFGVTVGENYFSRPDGQKLPQSFLSYAFIFVGCLALFLLSAVLLVDISRVITSAEGLFYSAMGRTTKVGRHNRKAACASALAFGSIASLSFYLSHAVVTTFSWDWAFLTAILGGYVAVETAYLNLYDRKGFWIGRVLDQCTAIFGLGRPSEERIEARRTPQHTPSENTRAWAALEEARLRAKQGLPEPNGVPYERKQMFAERGDYVPLFASSEEIDELDEPIFSRAKRVWKQYTRDHPVWTTLAIIAFVAWLAWDVQNAVQSGDWFKLLIPIFLSAAAALWLGSAAKETRKEFWDAVLSPYGLGAVVIFAPMVIAASVLGRHENSYLGLPKNSDLALLWIPTWVAIGSGTFEIRRAFVSRAQRHPETVIHAVMSTLLVTVLTVSAWSSLALGSFMLFGGVGEIVGGRFNPSDEEARAVLFFASFVAIFPSMYIWGARINIAFRTGLLDPPPKPVIDVKRGDYLIAAIRGAALLLILSYIAARFGPKIGVWPQTITFGEAVVPAVLIGGLVGIDLAMAKRGFSPLTFVLRLLVGVIVFGWPIFMMGVLMNEHLLGFLAQPYRVLVPIGLGLLVGLIGSLWWLAYRYGKSPRGRISLWINRIDFRRPRVLVIGVLLGIVGLALAAGWWFEYVGVWAAIGGALAFGTGVATVALFIDEWQKLRNTYPHGAGQESAPEHEAQAAASGRGGRSAVHNQRFPE